MRLKILLLCFVASIPLAACAPENLDITPSPTATFTPEPTNTPTPTNTPAPTSEAGAEATPEPEASAADTSTPLGVVEAVIAALPNPINAGTIQWQRIDDPTTGAEIVYPPNIQDGAAGRVYFSERGGGAADVTIAMFESEEAASTYFEQRSGDRRLESSAEEANLPTPNMFGGGTYGSMGLIQDGELVLVVSIPRFSSTVSGNPTIPMARQFLQIIDQIRGTE